MSFAPRLSRFTERDSGDYWPRNSFIKYPGVITVEVGPPIDTRGLSAEQINQAAESWIEATVARLRGAGQSQPVQSFRQADGENDT